MTNSLLTPGMAIPHSSVSSYVFQEPTSHPGMLDSSMFRQSGLPHLPRSKAQSQTFSWMRMLRVVRKRREFTRCKTAQESVASFAAASHRRMGPRINSVCVHHLHLCLRLYMCASACVRARECPCVRARWYHGLTRQAGWWSGGGRLVRPRTCLRVCGASQAARTHTISNDYHYRSRTSPFSAPSLPPSPVPVCTCSPYLHYAILARGSSWPIEATNPVGYA